MSESHTKGNRLITRILDSVGDGTGEFQMTGDYSENPTEFLAKPLPEDGLFEVHSGAYHWTMVGKSIPGAGYGTSEVPLINGVQALWRHQGVLITHFMAGGAVTTNVGWTFSPIRIHEHPSGKTVGMSTFTIGFEFLRTWGTPLILENGHDELVFIMHDDFTNMIEHFVVIHGYDRRKHPVQIP